MAPLLGIAAGTLAAFLVNTAASIAISYGLNLLAKKIAGEPQVQKPKGGLRINIEPGEDTPEVVACGLVCTEGVLRYDNTYDKANKYWQRVYELSSWYSTSLERVALNGEWVTLTDNGSSRGLEVTSGDYAGYVWIKFLNGTQVAADSYLTSNDNPNGRWTSDHIGYGLTYAIVTFKYHREDMTSAPDVRFEFKGAPLYDPRLDTTVGGSGSHRWNDVTTWQYSANPILMDYCYRRGGFAYGGETFCGMNMTSAELPLDKYIAAANICDEWDDSGSPSERRYECSIFLDATVEHRENLQNLLQSCAGMNVDSVATAYPVINASQTPVAELSFDDVVDGTDYEFDKDGSFGDIVNSVNGTYTEPEFVYEATGYGEQTLTSLQTLDRRTLDSQMSFPMVLSKRQAEQLASIYLSETRYAATKKCTLLPKWQILEPGDWITWLDDDDGVGQSPSVNRVYQVISKRVHDLESDTPRAVSVELQERDASIYTSVGPVSPPIRPSNPAAPTFLNEVENFAVIQYQLQGDGTDIYPAFRASWDAVDDETISNVLVEWQPKNQSPSTSFSVTVPVDQTVVILQEGVVASTIYEVRTKLISDNRSTVYSAWTDVTSGTLTLSIDAEISAEILEVLQEFRTEIDRLMTDVPLGITESMIAIAEEASKRETLAVQVGGIEAAVVEERVARITADSANASAITAVEATANQATASGLIKLEATAAPSGAVASFGTYLRATSFGAFTEAAEFLEILEDGTSRKVIAADRTVMRDSAGNIYAMFDDSGAYFDNARIRNLNAENIQVNSLTVDQIAINGVGGETSESVELATLDTTTSSSLTNLSGMLLTLTVGRSDERIRLDFVAMAANSSNTSTTYFQFTRDGTPLATSIEMRVNTFSGGVPQPISMCIIDNPGIGTFDYRVRWRRSANTAQCVDRALIATRFIQ